MILISFHHLFWFEFEFELIRVLSLFFYLTWNGCLLGAKRKRNEGSSTWVMLLDYLKLFLVGYCNSLDSTYSLACLFMYSLTHPLNSYTFLNGLCCWVIWLKSFHVVLLQFAWFLIVYVLTHSLNRLFGYLSWVIIHFHFHFHFHFHIHHVLYSYHS